VGRRWGVVCAGLEFTFPFNETARDVGVSLSPIMSIENGLEFYDMFAHDAWVELISRYYRERPGFILTASCCNVGGSAGSCKIM